MDNWTLCSILSLKGDILIKRLEHNKTPGTVGQFCCPCTKGDLENSIKEAKGRLPSYNGLKVPRVIPDFMIQGGIVPLGTGTGNPEISNLIDEIPQGFWDMTLTRFFPWLMRGPGTNGSQFFITHVPTPWC